MYQSISRVTRTKEKARENYNRLSRWYDLIAGKSEEKYRDLGYQILAPKEGEYILEIGIGTGQCLVPFYNAVGSKGLISGIDLSDGMALISRQRLIDAGIQERVGLCLADGVQLPFCSSKFDGVFLSFTLELFDTPEITDVLFQSKKILKTNGRIVVVSLFKTEKPQLPERIYEWVHDRMPVMVDCRPIPVEMFLIEAGFTIEETIFESMWGLPVAIIRGKKQKPIS
jgi:demethylmenaquinone methyltransferase/2-methoxy-6-polyprenyl-1,4-benzoquinol methylase